MGFPNQMQIDLMEYTVALGLAAALVIGLLLYLGLQVIKARHDRRARNRAERGQDADEYSVCRHGIDDAGNWVRVRTSVKAKI